MPEHFKNGADCIIVGAGEHYETPHIGHGDLVIAADGGYEHLQRMGIRADVVIGDFDSMSYPPTAGSPRERARVGCKAKRVSSGTPHVIALPEEKDDTDTLAAVKYGLSKGFRSFRIYGGTGGRFDHTLANIQTLAYLGRQRLLARDAPVSEGSTKNSVETDYRGTLYGDGWAATCIFNGEITFDGTHSGTVSVFAHSDAAEGVTIEGLKYELRNATLTNAYPLGVSNEFTGKESRISVERGTLIIVYQTEG